MTTADVVIANSDYTRAHVLREYDLDPAKVIAVPRGVDLSKFDPTAVDAVRLDKLAKDWGIERSDGRTRFLLAGRLTRWKGQALVIEALKELNRSDVQLILAGDDQGRSDYTQELRVLAARLGVEAQVKIVGHCADMPSAYSLCDFALAPSLEPEAFGRTAVEPQAMGRPVLAAKHGATAETVEDGVTGWLVTPGDATAWADAMRVAVQTSAPARAVMGASGRARVHARFSLSAMCVATLDIYRSLLT